MDNKKRYSTRKCRDDNKTSTSDAKKKKKKVEYVEPLLIDETS